MLAANLDHTGTTSMGWCQCRSEIQIMGEHHMPVFQCPAQNGLILRLWISKRGPMNCRPASVLQERYPLRRQIHVHDNPQAQGVTKNSSSRASNLQAA